MEPKLYQNTFSLSLKTCALKKKLKNGICQRMALSVTGILVQRWVHPLSLCGSDRRKSRSQVAKSTSSYKASSTSIEVLGENVHTRALEWCTLSFQLNTTMYEINPTLSVIALFTNLLAEDHCVFQKMIKKFLDTRTIVFYVSFAPALLIVNAAPMKGDIRLMVTDKVSSVIIKLIKFCIDEWQALSAIIKSP